MIGVDLVHIPAFSEKMKDEVLLARMFTEQELAYAKGSIETLAGIFATKEAYFKAVKKTPEWHAIEVVHDPDGAPVLQCEEPAETSISHDGAYAVAVVMV